MNKKWLPQKNVHGFFFIFFYFSFFQAAQFSKIPLTYQQKSSESHIIKTLKILMKLWSK